VLAKVLGAIGRTLITAGTLILLFVAYQLWGTGLQEAKAQKVLSKDFEAQLAAADQATTTSSTTAPPTTSTTAPTPGSTPKITVEKTELATQDLPLPATGDPVAKIRIPSIGVSRTVVEGVSLDQLKRGPGHYPETPLPGQKGNVSIAGHRTTYGQPFHNVDKVKVGDQVIFETLQGTFVYEITESLVVEPNQVEILEDKGDNRVTLIACHPKYSAAQRLILIGKLVGKPAPALTGQAEAREKARDGSSGDALAEGASIDGGLSGTAAARWPAIFWGLVAAAIWFVTWVIQTLLRRRMRRRSAEGEVPTRGDRLLTWTPYLVGVPVFLVALYVFFENFGRLLPGNY
jgi:sortase A